MSLFIVSMGQSDKGIPDAYFPYARARVAAWVADPSHGTITEWPTLLDIVAGMVDNAEQHQPITGADLDRVAALDDETVATACALAAVAIQLTGGDSPTVSAQYMEADLPVAGACIISFIGGKPRSGLAMSTLARLITTLSTNERAAIVSNVAACMTVMRFTPDEVRALAYPTDAEAPTDGAKVSVVGCKCADCEKARADAVTDPQN